MSSIIRTWFNPYWIAEKHLDEAYRCYRIFQESKMVEDLVKALQKYEDARSCSGREHEKYPSILFQYASALDLYSQMVEEPDSHMDRVLRYLQEIQEIWETKKPLPRAYGRVLHNLATAHESAYRRNSSPSHLSKAAEIYQKALDLPNNSHRRGALIWIGNAYRIECETSTMALIDSVGKLKMAIGYLNEAYSLSEDNYNPGTQATVLQYRACANDLLYRRLPEEPNMKMEYLNNAISDNAAALQGSILEDGLGELNLDEVAMMRCSLTKQYLRRHMVQRPRNPKDLANAHIEFETLKAMLHDESWGIRQQIEGQIAMIEGQIAMIDVELHNLSHFESPTPSLYTGKEFAT